MAAASTGKGGGIWMDLSTIPLHKFTLSITSFLNNGPSEIKGRDLYLKGPNLKTIVNGTSFGFALSEGASRGYSMHGEGSPFPADTDLSIFLLGYQLSPVYLGSGGGDEMYCGLSEYKCTLLSTALAKVLPSSVTLKFSAGDYSQDPLPFGSKSYKYEGTAPTTINIPAAASNVIFTVGANTLELHTVSVVPSTAQLASIITSSGSLTIKDSSLKAANTISTLTSPLISITGGSTVLQGVVLGWSTQGSGDCAGIKAMGFNSFEVSGVKSGNDPTAPSLVDGAKATNGNGGGLHLTQTGSQKINVTTVAIENCAAKAGSGLGGGIYLSSTDSSAVLTLSALTFSSNSAGKGSAVYVVASSLPGVVTPSRFDWTEGITGQQEHPLWGNQPAGNFSTPIDLYTFITGYLTSPFHLKSSNSANDQIYCGMSNFKCNSIQFVLDNKTSSLNSFELQIESGSYSQSQLEVNAKTITYTRTGSDEASIDLTSSQTVSFPITSGSLSLSMLSLFLSVENCGTLSSLSGGSLTLQSSIIKPKSASLTFSSPILSITGGTVSIKATRIGGVDSSSALGGIDAMSFTKLEILDSSCLEFCKGIGADGGGLYATPTAGSTLNISSSSFKNCLTTSEGKGGGIYTDVRTITLSNLKFSITLFENNGPPDAIGKDLYLLSSNLISVVNTTSFGFALIDETTPKSYSLWGNDNIFTPSADLYIFLLGYKTNPYYVTQTGGGSERYCGSEAYKCNSMETALLKAEDENHQKHFIFFIRRVCLFISECKRIQHEIGRNIRGRPLPSKDNIQIRRILSTHLHHRDIHSSDTHTNHHTH
jgi:hypothetical protein